MGFKADKIYWDQCMLDLEEAEDQLENVRMMALKKARETKPEWMRERLKIKDKHDNSSLSDESFTLEDEVSALRATEIGCFTLNAINKVSALRGKVEKTNATYAKL